LVGAGRGVNFSLDDRHRSLRRFLMNALGSPPWRVRTERGQVADEERPVAVVEVVGAVTQAFARSSIPQGDVMRRQAFTLTLYPQLGPTPAESRLAAAQLTELLTNAIGIGLDDEHGAVLSAPEMLPVYDFEGVPVKSATRAGPEEPYGHLTVEDFPVRPIQDPEDPLRWTVACDLRVSWWQSGRLAPSTGTVTGLRPVAPSTWARPIPPAPRAVGDP
jgi:hypothetical protein